MDDIKHLKKDLPLGTLLKFIQNINSSLELDELLHLIMVNVSEAVKAEASSVFLVDDKTNDLYIRTATGEKEEVVKTIRVPLGEGIAGWVAKEGQPLLIADAEQDPRFKKSISDAIGFTTKSVMCVPLMSEGGIIGVIEVINAQEKEEFDMGDMDFLLILADQVASSLRNAKVYSAVSKENENLKQILEVKRSLVGASPQMTQIVQMIPHAAEADCPVLFLGERGVGKEHVARTIHQLSPRSSFPFTMIDFATLVQSAVDLELFGSEGTGEKRVGKIEMSQGGTLYLNEICALSLMAQEKLFKIINERKFIQFTGEPVLCDVRFMAATSRDTAEEVRRGKFLETLFMRFSEYPLTIPPLRERREDIPLLVNHFIEYFNERYNKQVKCISNVALSYLLKERFDGNVRELENIVHEAIATMEGDTIWLEHLPYEFRYKGESVFESEKEIPSLDEVDREHILKVLDFVKGDKLKAARILRITKRALEKKIGEA